ncbi:MAG: hypothetical protein JNG88_13580 [Phycisphaerales bacterium]|nr:hypothetical protein [Phycisphaerales bacterium]
MKKPEIHTCLTDEGIDALARGKDDTVPEQIAACSDCRARLAAARENLRLLDDIRELDRTRQEIAPLLRRRA